MSEKDIENLTLESYENEFSFKENKSKGLSYYFGCFNKRHFSQRSSSE